jgi:hypothetical protein
MARSPRTTSAPWLVAMLVSILLLGHVCELPAFIDLVTHATGSDHHHEADHHSGDGQISCDVLDARYTAYPQVGVGPESAQISPSDRSLPARAIGLLAEETSTPPPRPPLFLLHRSLLI